MNEKSTNRNMIIGKMQKIRSESDARQIKSYHLLIQFNLTISSKCNLARASDNRIRLSSCLTVIRYAVLLRPVLIVFQVSECERGTGECV